MQNQAEQLYDYHSEEIVIAAILINNEYFDTISEFLTVDTFHNSLFREAYRVCQILISTSKTADPQTVAMYTQNANPNFDSTVESVLLDAVGKYLNSLALYNISQKAQLLRNLYQKRESIKAIQDFVPSIQNKSEDTQATIQTLEDKLYHIMDTGSSESFSSLGEIFSGIVNKIQYIKDHGTRPSIDTGYYDINAKISGWSKGDLIILAGRPSMGKTALAIGMALKAAQYVKKDSQSVAVFSLEMSAEQLVNRMIAVQTGVGGHKIASGTVNDGEFQVVVNAMDEFTQIPIIIDDTPALTIPDLRTKIRRMKRKHNISFAIVDYLQLMRSSRNAKDNRVQEISEITQNLKAIAREFKIPIVALSQLSRNVESREDKRPQLQDLRDSGSIEQDADIVMFLYRESYYLERSMPSKENVEAYNKWMEENGEKYLKIENTAEVIIGKHRNGPIGTALLRFDKETTKFDNLAKSDAISHY
ncbi:MAG: replicative DNA helicase [Candidatus Deianiraeaceae bacterium]|jgi:replicative DNA helicase